MRLMRVTVDHSDVLRAMDRFIGLLQFDPSGGQRELFADMREALVDQIDDSGHDSAGGTGTFSGNTKRYNEDKRKQGYGDHNMIRTGKLRGSVEKARGKYLGGKPGEIEYELSWDTVNPETGQNYAEYYQEGQDRAGKPPLDPPGWWKYGRALRVSPLTVKNIAPGIIRRIEHRIEEFFR